MNDSTAHDDAQAPLPSPGPLETNDKSQFPATPKEIGGPKGPEPTRFGDWERNGRCVDF